LSLLRQAGFTLNVDHSNPAVKDRINSVCAMTLNAEARGAGSSIRQLPCAHRSAGTTGVGNEQVHRPAQRRPDKTTGHDHPNDAVGYFLTKRFPVIKRTAHVTELRI